MKRPARPALPALDDPIMSAAALLKPGPATLADLLALPGDGQGYEILDGELTEKQTSGEHGFS